MYWASNGEKQCLKRGSRKLNGQVSIRQPAKKGGREHAVEREGFQARDWGVGLSLVFD